MSISKDFRLDSARKIVKDLEKELLTFAASHTTLYDGNVAIDGNGYQTDGSDLDHRYDCMNGVGCCERDYCDIITQSFSEQDEIQNQVKKMTFKSEMTSREQSSGALWHMFNESRELGQLQGDNNCTQRTGMVCSDIEYCSDDSFYSASDDVDAIQDHCAICSSTTLFKCVNTMGMCHCCLETAFPTICWK